jgi:hypothetical protein
MAIVFKILVVCRNVIVIICERKFRRTWAQLGMSQHVTFTIGAGVHSSFDGQPN